MVSALVSRSSTPGSSRLQGDCVVFLGKTLYSHSACLHPGLQTSTGECWEVASFPLIFSLEFLEYSSKRKKLF